MTLFCNLFIERPSYLQSVNSSMITTCKYGW